MRGRRSGAQRAADTARTRPARVCDRRSQPRTDPDRMARASQRDPLQGCYMLAGASKSTARRGLALRTFPNKRRRDSNPRPSGYERLLLVWHMLIAGLLSNYVRVAQVILLILVPVSGPVWGRRTVAGAPRTSRDIGPRGKSLAASSSLRPPSARYRTRRG